MLFVSGYSASRGFGKKTAKKTVAVKTAMKRLGNRSDKMKSTSASRVASGWSPGETLG